MINSNCKHYTANCASPLPGPSLADTCGGSSFILFMGLLETFLSTQCDIDNPCSRVNKQFKTKPDNNYDFIVVGGGSAGSVVASRLSEIERWKVLLIEAGGHEPVGAQVPSMFRNFIGSDIDWRYRTEPESNACLSSPGKRCYWPRGKVLGGTSVMNGMMYSRGNREDYDNWDAMGNPGWKFEDVLPFFLKSEDNHQICDVDTEYHSKGGSMPVSKFPYNPPLSYAILKGSQEMGYGIHDLNGKNSTGFMIAQTTSFNGIRYSSARSFLRPARRRKNLHILLNTTVSRVLVHPGTKTTLGVEIIDQHGSMQHILARKEVIVSGGTVNSPQILLLSGIGPEEDLLRVNVLPVHNLPGVGKNLHNHVAYLTNFFLNESDTSPLNWATAMDYLLFRNGPMSGTGIFDVTAKIVTPYSDRPNVPDLQLYFSGYLANCARTGQVGELLSNGSRRIQISPTVLHARSRGYITLASADPLDPPRIFANYLSDERDVKTLVEGIKFAIRLSQTSSLKQYGMRLDDTVVKGCEAMTFGSDEYWECAVRQNTGPENHQAGSCKMGPAHDPSAVVDHELRVHGIQGLRVMDASIMPVVTSGNIYAPIVMIAEKGAHMIKMTWLNREEIQVPYYRDQYDYQCNFKNRSMH